MRDIENTDFQRAKELLTDGAFTCVVISGDYLFTSTERGVKPLLELLEGQSVEGGVAADKVVGKAAAFLYVLLGIKILYANIISELALDVLKKHQIEVFYANIVPMIRNRTDTGYCPMEQATCGIEDPKEALDAIKATLKSLK